MSRGLGDVYKRQNTGCPVFLTACCYLVIGNPTVIIMRLKYNVHSLIYSKPIFEEKREPENKKYSYLYCS